MHSMRTKPARSIGTNRQGRAPRAPMDRTATTTQRLPSRMLLAILCAAGCASPPGEASPPATKTDSTHSALVGGTLNDTPGGPFLDPNIGETEGECGATLIAGQWLLTAGHCVNFQNKNSIPMGACNGGVPGYCFSTAPDYYPSHGIGKNSAVSAAVFNLGPQSIVIGSSGSGFTNAINMTPANNGNYDVALLMLGKPLSDPTTNTVTSNVTLATSASMPLAGSNVVTWGFGGGAIGLGGRNYLPWTYQTPGIGRCSQTYVPTCMIGDVGYNVSWGQTGDSGGPSLMNGNETIFAVTSRTSSGGGLVLGDVAGLQPQLCSIMYNHPHRFCQVGTPLGGEPAGCGPFLPTTNTNITTAVLNEAAFQYCGTSQWDQGCVSEAQRLVSWEDWSSCVAPKGSTFDSYSDILLSGNFVDGNGNSYVPLASSEGNGVFCWSDLRSRRHSHLPPH